MDSMFSPLVCVKENGSQCHQKNTILSSINILLLPEQKNAVKFLTLLTLRYSFLSREGLYYFTCI